MKGLIFKMKNKVLIGISILVIVLTFSLLFLWNKKEDKTENKLEYQEIILTEKEAISKAETLFYKYYYAYWRRDLVFEQENDKNKIYTFDNLKYYHLTNYDYIRYMLTNNGLLAYNLTTNLLTKDDNYYLPVDFSKPNELWSSRIFKVKSRTKDKIELVVVSEYCNDIKNCLNKTTKENEMVIINEDDVWKIDEISIDD